MKVIKVRELEKGMVNASPLFNDDNEVVIQANHVIGPTDIEKLQELGFEEIQIYDDDKIAENASFISEEIRIKAIRNGYNLDIDDVKFIANQLISDLHNKDVSEEVGALCAADSATYRHSLNVEIISVLLGINLGMTNEELKILALSALLHDVGKRTIDDNVLNKPGKLDNKELDQMRLHPELGFALLKNCDVPQEVRFAVLEHHENEDGSGYPKGLKGMDISMYAKIIHVADVYEAMRAKRSYKDSFAPGEVIENMMAQGGLMFDLQVLRVFQRTILPYSTGMQVKLSDGSVGEVIANNRNSVLRPIVQVNGHELNLEKVLNITIVDTL